MSNMTDYDVESSFYQWFGDNYSWSDVDWAQPYKFDENDFTRWVHVKIDTIDESPVRRVGNRMFEVVVQITAWSKDQTEQYGALSVASEVKELLRHATVPVFDQSVSDTPRIGTIQLYEPSVQDVTTQEGDVPAQARVVTVRGKAEQQLQNCG